MNVNQILGSGTSKVGTDAGVGNQLGQEDFLKLLVAQMKNQDPANPADNGEFLSQIAQFSMVSGIDDLGTSFNGVASSLYTAQAMQASSLVGREVLTESSSATLKPGGAISGFVQYSDNSSAITLKVRDQSGALVSTIDLGIAEPGVQPISWNGLDQDGNALPGGRYFLSVDAVVQGEQRAVPVHLFNAVESISVNRSNNSILLHLDSNESVGLSQVSEFK